jgi:hypothetical protein
LHFEPGGRIWFGGSRLGFVLGFDGHEWVERRLDDGRLLDEEPAPGFQGTRQSPIVTAGGRVFLPCTDGVHVFDGREWTSLRTKRTADGIRPIQLLRQQDGAGVLMLRDETEQKVWLWRDGDWSQIRCPIQHIADACPTPDGRAWLFGVDGTVVTVPLRADGKPTADPAPLVARLRAATTADDRSALADMLAATNATTAIEEAMASSLEPDFLAGLATALKKIRRTETNRLGDFAVGSGRFLGLDNAQGTAIVAVREARRGDERLGDGLLVVPPRDPVRFLAADAVARGALFIRSIMFAADGRSVWVESKKETTAVFRLDLDTGAVSARVPDPLFGWPLATLPDGTIFVARRHPRAAGTSLAMAAFRPGKTDDFVSLTAESWPLSDEGWGYLGVDAAGGVWANRADIGLARFHDGVWNAVPIPDGDGRGSVTGMLAGSRGDVILRGTVCGYWRQGESRWEPSLKSLVKENRNTIAASFGSDQRPRTGWSDFSVASDNAGNVWMVDHGAREFGVFVGDGWVDARPELQKAGSGIERPDSVVGLGDGTVYAGQRGAVHGSGRSFFATITAGRPVFRAAPCSFDIAPAATGIRDRQGGWWLSTDVGIAPPDTPPPGPAKTDQLAVRLVAGRTETTLRNAGWPVLCDADGVVWLDRVQGHSPGTLNLWRDGAMAGSVTIPGLMTDPPLAPGVSLINDRPGSVVARTGRGLTHLVADGVGGSYRVAARYTLRGIDGGFWPVASAADGMLVAVALDDSAGPLDGAAGSRRIALVRLPRPDTLSSPEKP